MKPVITLEMLLGGEEILAQGITTDDHNGLNMTNSGKELKWIAKRGRANDWAVYTYWATASWSFVEYSGDKVSMKDNLQNILEFSEDVYKHYRR